MNSRHRLAALLGLALIPACVLDQPAEIAGESSPVEAERSPPSESLSAGTELATGFAQDGLEFGIDGEFYDELLILERQALVEDKRPVERYDRFSSPASPARRRGRRALQDVRVPVVLPGSGELRRVLPEGEEQPPREDVALPLERTDVVIEVLGPVATGGVRQRFRNPFDVPIEAVYVFPLPHDAAVHDFVLTIGDRRIRGVVREREEAQRLYAAARAQGYTAALLSQQRPNVFTQSVANLAPGQPIDVELAYLEPVDYADGWHELAFPMVVGPRYNPVGAEDPIGATARGAGGSTDVEYLRPHERSGHDISLEVRLDAGLGVSQIESPTHTIDVEERARGAHIRLSEADAIPNADFRLRWKPAGNGLRTSLVRQGDHALLTIYPPTDLGGLPRRAIEHVFVLDTSGSMSGEPLAALKRAMRAALARLEPDDTFHILHFSNTTGALAPTPLASTPANLRSAREWLDGLEAGGGTEMLGALEAALGRDSDGSRPRVVTFLTDGQLSNEDQILAMIQRRRAEARVFAFSVGSSPNRYLMAEMARRSGGAEAAVGLDGDPVPEVEAFFQRASRPAVQDLQLSFSGASAGIAAELPRELLIGRPLSVPVRLEGAGGRVVASVLGRVEGGLRDLARVEAHDVADMGRGVLGKVWARATLTRLAAEARLADESERGGYESEMRDLALEHGLVSSFTSFLAIDSAAPVTDGGDPATVKQAVPIPAGQSYDTTVGTGAAGPGAVRRDVRERR